MHAADDVEVTVTDADMEDPELLAELAALTGGPPPAKPKPPADLAARRANLQDRIAAKKKGNGIGANGARALAISLEKNTTLVTLGLNSARLCARWLGRGAMWRAPTACGGRARARVRCRARLALVQLGGAARVRRRVSLPGAWLLLVGA